MTLNTPAPTLQMCQPKLPSALAQCLLGRKLTLLRTAAIGYCWDCSRCQTHTQRKHTQMSHVAGFTGGHSPVTLGTIKAPFKAPSAAEFHIPSSWKRRFPFVNPRVCIMFYFVSLSAQLYLSSCYLIPASPQTTESFAHHLPCLIAISLFAPQLNYLLRLG